LKVFSAAYLFESAVGACPAPLFNAANEKMGECATDNYGDFKESSGKYTGQIA
jgi:hypothetical protein